MPPVSLYLLRATTKRKRVKLDKNHTLYLNARKAGRDLLIPTFNVLGRGKTSVFFKYLAEVLGVITKANGISYFMNV